MKKVFAVVLAVVLCLTLWSCKEEQTDYTEAILGMWYVVEYENEFVEFCEDGTVVDTFGSEKTYGDYIVDNENMLLWVNFGDDYFTIQIVDEDGRIILLDNNGTLVREEDCAEARAEYRAQNKK